MQWQRGQLVCQNISPCAANCGRCEHVCPVLRKDGRQSYTGAIDTQDRPAGDFWRGHVLSDPTRLASASGGLVTWLLCRLLESQKIDAAICVGQQDRFPFFAFRMCRTAAEIQACRNSAYYPVHAADVLAEVARTPGRYAMVALPCLANAVRRLQQADRRFERIAYMLSLTCGMQKTAYYADYFCMAAGVPLDRRQNVWFRSKSPDRPVSKYVGGCTWTDRNGQQRRADISLQDMPLRDIWGRCYFTPMGCLCCDDVFGVEADAVFMDAWLPGYSEDTKGWSLCATRSPELDAMIEGGIGVMRERVDGSVIIQSQLPVLRQKRDLLPMRLAALRKMKVPLPGWAEGIAPGRASRRACLQVCSAMESRARFEACVDQLRPIDAFHRSMAGLDRAWRWHGRFGQWVKRFLA